MDLTSLTDEALHTEAKKAIWRAAVGESAGGHDPSYTHAMAVMAESQRRHVAAGHDDRCRSGVYDRALAAVTAAHAGSVLSSQRTSYPMVFTQNAWTCPSWAWTTSCGLPPPDYQNGAGMTSTGPVIVTVQDEYGTEKRHVDRDEWNLKTPAERTAWLDGLYGDENGEASWWIEDPDDEAATAG